MIELIKYISGVLAEVFVASVIITFLILVGKSIENLWHYRKWAKDFYSDYPERYDTIVKNKGRED